MTQEIPEVIYRKQFMRMLSIKTTNTFRKVEKMEGFPSSFPWPPTGTIRAWRKADAVEYVNRHMSSDHC